MKHLVKRYQEYYADEEFLREMIGPLLRDIITSAQEMKQANILLDDEVGEVSELLLHFEEVCVYV